MSPKVFSFLCICQALVLALFTGFVVLRTTGDPITPVLIVMMGVMIAARLWRTRTIPL